MAELEIRAAVGTLNPEEGTFRFECVESHKELPARISREVFAKLKAAALLYDRPIDWSDNDGNCGGIYPDSGTDSEG